VERGIASFNRIRYGRHDGDAILYAFDPIELSGEDLRREPLDVRKATLQSLLIKTGAGIRLNEHIEGDGESVFRHACKMGLEGIVSKRKDFALPLRALARLAQDEEPECTRVVAQLPAYADTEVPHSGTNRKTFTHFEICCDAQFGILQRCGMI
jgi:hypothetical protein